MAVSPSAHNGPSSPLPKRLKMAIGAVSILLFVSLYGGWLLAEPWLNALPVTLSDIVIGESIVFGCSFAALVIAVYVGRRYAVYRLGQGYQTRMEKLQSRLNEQEDFSRALTDCTTEALTVFDRNNAYWFVNKNAADRLGVTQNEVIGKPAIKLLGFDRMRKIEARLNAVRSTRQPIEIMEQTRDAQGGVVFYQSHYSAIDAFGDFSGGVLLREENVTNIVVERERRAAMLRQVISALVAVVDKRDPFAVGHSERVGRLARSIAEDMGLSESDANAADIAGALMNFGKVLVPTAILTKTTPLSPQELAQVREGIITTADILAMINFQDAVVPTLRQVLERVDGSGAPHGLRGDQILMTARIVAVANAFVAMVSPRAHRAGLTPVEAVARLMGDADKQFDRSAVTALNGLIQKGH